MLRGLQRAEVFALPRASAALRRRRPLGLLYFGVGLGLVGIEKTEGMRWLDHVNAGLDLLLSDLRVQLVHLGPMNLRLVVMLSVITVVKPDRIIGLAVAAPSPGDRFIWVPSEMTVIPVKIREAVTEIIERHVKEQKFPVQDPG